MNDSYPEFEEIFAISDLHISVCEKQQIFFAGELLADTIRNLRNGIETEHRVALVINGDFIDFLAIPNASLFDREGAPGTLRRIMADKENEPIFEALAGFVRDGRPNTLVIVVGNHDIELCLPTVQEALLQRLAGDDHTCRGRIIFVDNGTGFRCQVGGCNVLFIHGNENDRINQIDHEGLRQAAYQLKHDTGRQSAVKPALGTLLVTRAFHKLKESYPLIDLIKPELRDNPPLLDAVMDDLGTLPGDIRSVIAGYTWSRIPLLEADHPRPGTLPDIPRPLPLAVEGDEMLVEIFHHLRNGTAFDMDRLNELENLDLSWRDVLRHPLATTLFRRPLISYFTAYGKEQRAERARKILLRQAKEREACHDIEGDDDIFSTIMDDPGIIGPAIHVLVAGHTHFRRFRPFAGNRIYCNTGTWIPIVLLTRQILESKKDFQRFLEIITMAEADQALKELHGKWEDPPLVRNEPSMVRIRRIERCACSVELLDVKTGGPLAPVSESFLYEVHP